MKQNLIEFIEKFFITANWTLTLYIWVGWFGSKNIKKYINDIMNYLKRILK